MSDRVERGTETIGETIDMFEDIAEAARDAESGIQEISDATDDQATSSEEVVAMVDEVSSVSQQTAARASSVSAATEEQTASLAEISESIQQLSELAENLHTQVSAFEIREDATDGTPAPADRASGLAASVSADGGVTGTEDGTDTAPDGGR